MIRYLRQVLLLLILTFDFLLVKSQSNDQFISTLKEKLSAWSKAVPYEDLYIHSDRESYVAGEYFFFSTFLFDRSSTSLSQESSYAYIELLDNANKPVAQTKVRLENGSGGGGFMLPDSLGSGEYTLRGYTSYMRNFLPYGCFMKTIIIYNPFKETTFNKKTILNFTDKSDYNIAFFPEGGRLLNGYKNKVGLRVFSKADTQKEFKGILTDEQNDTTFVVNIDSTGIGSFEFTPERGKVYKLISNNGKRTFFLPVISQTGYSINVTNVTNGFLKITINTEGVSAPGGNYFYVIIQSRGNIVTANKVDFNSKSTEHLIAWNNLALGINQISIFDSNGKPVCTRYVFKPLPVSGILTLKTKDVSGKREKIALEIGIDSGIVTQKDFSNFSLSVSAKDGIGNSSGIIDYLITGTEFSTREGDGITPVGIFKLSPETIDNYLLSVSGNWIKWDEVIRGGFPVIRFPREKEKQIVSGYYRNNNLTEPNFKKILFLSVPGKIPVFKYSETDEEGRFVFEIRDQDPSTEYIIQPADAKDNFSLQMESTFSKIYPPTGFSTDSGKINLSSEMADLSVNYQVEKIYGLTVTGDSIKPEKSPRNPVRFYGKPDLELILKDYISLPTMQEVFFELIPGVSVKTNKSKYTIYIQDPVSREYYDNPPALMIDGVIINDPAAIFNLDPELVEKIDIIKGEYIVGEVFLNGIISVITKAGDFSNVPLPSNAVKIKGTGYDLVRRYKSPDYGSESSKNGRIPDFRNTIYWNHSLKPDGQGKIIVEIVTSDFASDFVINVQGTSGGKLFSARKTIRVE